MFDTMYCNSTIAVCNSFGYSWNRGLLYKNTPENRKLFEEMDIKTENPTYNRDITSRALLSTDKKAVDEYKSKKAMIQKAKDNEKKIEELEEKVDSINNKIDAILEIIKGK